MDLISRLSPHFLFHVFDKIAKDFTETDLINFAHTSRQWRKIVEDYDLLGLIDDGDELFTEEEIDKGTRCPYLIVNH